MTVRDWTLVGPFRPNNGPADLDMPIAPKETVDSLPVDEFTRFVQTVSTGAAEISPIDGSSDVARRVSIRNIDCIMFQVAYQVRYFPPDNVLYAACRIQCAEERTVHAMLELMGAAKIFLNGTLVGQGLSPRQRPYERSFSLSLKRGDNLLVVKLTSLKAGNVNLGLRLEPSVESAIAAALATNRVFIKNSVLTNAEPLEISIPGAPCGGRLRLEILNPSGGVVETASFGNNEGPSSPSIDSDNAKIQPGLYRARTTYDGKSYEEAFCVGEPAAVLQALQARAKLCRQERAIEINCGALERRMQILLQPEHNRPSSSLWRRRVVYALMEYEDIVDRLERGAEPCRGVPGLHVRGFESRIDGAVQYYRVYAPANVSLQAAAGITAQSGAGWPVIMLVPPPVSTARPFIESTFLAQQFVAEDLAQIAERQRVILVWPGYRGAPSWSPAELAHLDEVLAEVSRDYPVDPHRISLAGSCAAGVMAVMTARQWPERFSGIGLLHPLVHRTADRMNAAGYFDHMPEYRAWRHMANAAEHLESIRGTPLWVLHNDTFPGHGSPEYSQQFADEARARGLRVRYDRMPRGDPEELDGFERLFAWLASQRRENASSKQALGMFDGHASFGPICRAFMDRFLVVEGTGGNDSDRMHVGRLSTEFQEAWHKVNYGDGGCRVKPDVSLTDDEIAGSNLILFGNAKTNTVWSRLGTGFPLELARDQVSLLGRKWAGGDLGIQAVFKNPRNPDRLVIVIGGANLANVRVGTMELSVDGWFDFAIWSNENLVTAGHYDKQQSP